MFGGLGTGLNRTGWVLKTFINIFFHSLLFLISVLGCNSPLAQLLHKENRSLFLSRFWLISKFQEDVSQVPPSQTGWTQSAELRWTIGCRSRILCWGNVCLCDWTVLWVYVNWASCNHTQAHVIRLPPWKRCLRLSPAWMFHFETVIEMDFCLILSHCDRRLKIPDSLSSLWTCSVSLIPENFLVCFQSSWFHAG